ncbi:MAG: hypothetical protein ACRDF0_07885 [Candidatus Limnocylindria bacterium]
MYYEIDPWGGRAKRINRSMEAWLAAADIIFTTAREPHISLFRKKGGRDIRFIPPTYCQITFTEAERTPPQDGVALAYDVVMVGSGLAHWGRVSQLPGAVQRATLVRRLQREPNLRVAIYGGGWSGRGAMGLLPHGEQPAAIRQGLISVNWDHYPQHESYASDRLPISMLAGRAHVTTAHPRFDWLPSEETGLFLAPTVPAVLRRIEEIMATPVEDILALGAAAHRWVKGRLSHREAARFMLAAIDTHLLDGLPEPWIGFARDWPN